MSIFESKAALQADLVDRAIAVNSIEISESDPGLAPNVKRYRANVLVSRGQRIANANIAYYTVDEGLPTEKAYYMDGTPERVGQVRSAAEAYVKAKVADDTFLRGWVESVDEEQLFAKARVFVVTGDLVTEKRIVIYRAGGSTVHKDFQPLA